MQLKPLWPATHFLNPKNTPHNASSVKICLADLVQYNKQAYV